MNNFYGNGYMNPYFTPQVSMQQPIQPVQPMQQQPQQQVQKTQTIEQPMQTYTPQNMYKQALGLQGKSVDSVDVVKATDIPFDGSISYFPLTDGSAIVTKQLQQDGTSKMIVYKPIEEKEEPQTPKYITSEEFNKAMENINNDDLKQYLEELKQEIRDLNEHVKKFDVRNKNNSKRD